MSANFTFTEAQVSRLLAMRAAREEGEDEERLVRLRQREEDDDTLRLCAKILTEGDFAAGRDLPRQQLLQFLSAVRALAPNPNLDSRLLAVVGEPVAFNRDLRDLLYGSNTVPLRLRQFLIRRHAGNQTALQLLCAVYPREWPLVTRAGLRALDLNADQMHTALQIARLTLNPIDGDIGSASVHTPELAEPTPDNDRVLIILANAVVYTAVRDLTEAQDYVAVHRLLTSGSPDENRPGQRRAALPGSARSRRAARFDAPQTPIATQVREPKPSDYRAISPAGDPVSRVATAPPDISAVRTATLLSEIEAEVSRRGFHYPPLILRDYFICLQSKPYVWLLGANGIGKTRLTSLFAEILTGNVGAQYRLIPVRPDWVDSSAVLGYVNLLAAGGEGRYVSTPFLDFLLRAAKPANNFRAYFLCFDEMNLARVEHYFAEVLSAMETSGHELALPHGQPLRMPDNLFVTGTLNTDEATHALARKVLDRANTISLQAVSLKTLRPLGPQEPSDETLSFVLRQAVFLQRRVTVVSAAVARLQQVGGENTAEWVVDQLVEVNTILEQYDLQVAYRARDEALCYCANSFDIDGNGLLAPETPIDARANLMVAMDFQLLQKVLPRLGGTQDQLEPLLSNLHQWAVRAKFIRSAAKLSRLLARLQRDGFVSYE